MVSDVTTSLYLYALSEYLYTSLVESEDRKFLRGQYYFLEGFKYSFLVELGQPATSGSSYLQMCHSSELISESNTYFSMYKSSQGY
jgi:hypothetical protein